MRTLILAATAAIGLAGAAHAQPPGGRMDPAAMIKAADKNNDGGLSKDEWTAAGRPAARFAMIDADKDGKVTPAEVTAAMARMRGGGGQPPAAPMAGMDHSAHAAPK